MTVEELFEKYRYASHEDIDEDDDDEDTDKITFEGLIKFCEDLGIEPDDIVLLVFFWKIKAKRQYIITKEEWIFGFKTTK
jgi:hypothetical protein